VLKHSDRLAHETVLADRKNMAYAGTLVTSGMTENTLGLCYVPMPVQPKPEDRSLSLEVQGGTVAFKNLEAHELQSAWAARKVVTPAGSVSPARPAFPANTASPTRP
jgi:hypothetical protein